MTCSTRFTVSFDKMKLKIGMVLLDERINYVQETFIECDLLWDPFPR